MKRLTLFAKGNVDVHDSLHSSRVGGSVVWNGINAVLREQAPEVLVRLRHETWTRSDALLAMAGGVPEELAARDPALGFHPLSSQFGSHLFDVPADAFILSSQPDVATRLWRHKKDGYLLYPNESGKWREEDRFWFKAQFEPVPDLTVEQSVDNFRTIIERLRVRGDVPILIYNQSPVVPGESIHCYHGLDETLANRIRRFNLGLVELSQATGVSIVDVDSLLARHGALALKVDAMHLTARGHELVAREVVNILGDWGVWSS